MWVGVVAGGVCSTGMVTKGESTLGRRHEDVVQGVRVKGLV